MAALLLAAGLRITSCYMEEIIPEEESVVLREPDWQIGQPRHTAVKRIPITISFFHKIG